MLGEPNPFAMCTLTLPTGTLVFHGKIIHEIIAVHTNERTNRNFINGTNGEDTVSNRERSGGTNSLLPKGTSLNAKIIIISPLRTGYRPCEGA